MATIADILKRVTSELPIEVFLQHVIDNDLINEELKKTVNEDSHNLELTINKFLVSKEITDINYHYSSRRVNIICPFHDTQSNDSTYYYHDVEAPRLSCRSANCKIGANKQSYNVVDLCQMIVHNVPPALLYLEGNSTFISSLRLCANLIGIEWESNRRELSQEEKNEFRKLSVYKTLVEVTHENFMKNNSFSRRAREYFFYERGFGQLGFGIRKLIRQFKIGYTGGKYGSTYLYKIMKKKGFTDEELLASGAFLYRKDKNFDTGVVTVSEDIADFFTNRLIFGYQRKNNTFDGIYGRDITFKEDIEKARKKMTTEYFEKYMKSVKKRRHLRTTGAVSEAINFHKASMFKSLIFVEGELDFLSLYGLGFENSVAVGGTNGIDQSDIDRIRLRRITSKYTVCNTIYLLFDNDENNAGETAMYNVGLSFIESGFDVRVVRIPEGDPNDCLKNYGLEAKDIIQKAIDEAVSFEAFYVEEKLKHADLKTFSSIKSVINTLRDFIINIPKHELIFIVLDLIQSMKKQNNLVFDEELILFAFGLKDSPSNIIEEPKDEKQIEETQHVDAQIEEEIINKNESVTLLDVNVLKEKNWLVYFEDLQRYEQFKSISSLENVVYSNNVTDFLEIVHQHLPEVKNVLPDSVVSEDTKTMLKNAKLSNHLFHCEDLSQLKGKFDHFIIKY